MDPAEAKKCISTVNDPNASSEDKRKANQKMEEEIIDFTLSKARTTAAYFNKLVENGVPETVATELTKLYITCLFKNK